MTKPLLVLGNKNYSSWSLRPFMAIAHSGLAFDEMVLPLDTQEFDQRIGQYNPARKVPVLVDGSLRVWDSLAILETLAERAPQLWPADPDHRAWARSVSAEMHSGFAALRGECPMNMRAEGRRVAISDAVQADIARIEMIWSECLEASGGPYLFGSFSNADAMYAPVASRFRTYGLAPGSEAYVKTIHSDPAFLRWREAALQETWIVEQDEAGG